MGVTMRPVLLRYVLCAGALAGLVGCAGDDAGQPWSNMARVAGEAACNASSNCGVGRAGVPDGPRGNPTNAGSGILDGPHGNPAPR